MNNNNKVHYAGIDYNDVVDGAKGVCLSYWTQGCPHKCKGCHNPETWDFEGGETDSEENIAGKIIRSINMNGITRNFSILGGEPLCDQNFDFVSRMVSLVRYYYPNILIFVWTGYVYERLTKFLKYREFFENIDYLIDGPYIEEQRDITLFLRGSKNQRVIDIKETLLKQEVITVEKI